MSPEELLQQYQTARIKTDEKLTRLVNNPFMFRMFLLGKLPMAFFAGVRIKHFDANQCSITVPYKWLNQNPFRSTYFAVLAMTAEISTGIPSLLAVAPKNPSVAMLVTHAEADFMKKATGLSTFTCLQGQEITHTVEKAILTGEGQTFDALTTGVTESGETIARFKIQWSFKMRGG
ncbi:MAG: DUF4442 domain-containing protein [Bacteroidetes bacterium]|nr:DUF4442 domain-containing protein [Bacteroidota bacterium]